MCARGVFCLIRSCYLNCCYTLINKQFTPNSPLHYMTTQVNGKTGNSTPCHPEPLNRSSQKAANVITSWISTDMQNLVAIPAGVSFPRMREIVHQNVYSASFLGSTNAPQPRPPNRFSRTIRHTTWFRARMWLFGVRKQKNI